MIIHVGSVCVVNVLVSIAAVYQQSYAIMNPFAAKEVTLSGFMLLPLCTSINIVTTFLVTHFTKDLIAPANNTTSETSTNFSKVSMSNCALLFLASIITAHKFLDDNSYKNKLWSDLNGKLFSCKDINLMERQFLSMLDYNLMVSQEEYDSLNSKLLSTFKLHQQKPLINSTFNIKTNDFYSCNSQNLILPPILSSNSFSRASSYDTLSSSLSSSNLDSDIDDLDELLDSISIGSNNTPNLSHFSP
ncbi:hypothetical protein HK099_000396 [Clydaea vesicula]|uniref:Cyclin N-terminal domain-containing protein n=1 Tax=Clydaea vesicula TaxID=447962 RepID=A0AAD5TWS0_9FUNG|nr:hypothetical protein HK099_000396 [Clydaea vesicula]